jgi:hypothetical protein
MFVFLEVGITLVNTVEKNLMLPEISTVKSG